MLRMREAVLVWIGIISEDPDIYSYLIQTPSIYIYSGESFRPTKV